MVKGFTSRVKVKHPAAKLRGNEFIIRSKTAGYLILAAAAKYPRISTGHFARLFGLYFVLVHSKTSVAAT